MTKFNLLMKMDSGVPMALDLELYILSMENYSCDSLKEVSSGRAYLL